MRDQYAMQGSPGHPAVQRPGRPRSAYVFKALATILACIPVVATGAARADAGLRTACDASVSTTVLHAQAGPVVEARAYWLDRHLIQWPGVAATGRFRLYRSATAALRAVPGQVVAGADNHVELAQAKVEMTAALAERFRFVGDGPRLMLSRDVDVGALLRDQLLLVREDDAGRVLDATAVQVPGALDDLYAAADDVALGAFRTVPPPGAEDFATRFALWAPTARNVAVCVYGDAAARALPAHRDDATGTWTLDLPGTLHGTRYAFLVDVFAPGAGLVRNRVTDPYSAALTVDSARSVVLDPDAADTKPPGWDAASRPAAAADNVDMTVYELHVRDFSRDDASVRTPWRGKYLAFTEAQSAGMRHLRALQAAGLTDVHLLPVYDFASVPERGCVVPQIPKGAPDAEVQQAAVAKTAATDCFNWGYDPWHYGAPEGSYAVQPDGAARIREFRAMVQSLHAAGLRVGMDVVYNHTFAAGQDPKSVLDRIVPGYYHRLDAAGKIARSTCCENTATEHRMMAKLMIDTAARWVRDYRIDSFRFDLMGHQPRAAMERLQRAVDAAAGRHVPLIGEGWNFGEVADGARFVQASQRSLSGSGIGSFSDRARDALRGGGCCDSGAALVDAKGWLNGLTGDGDEAAARRAADLVRVGLGGTLATMRMTTADGRTQAFSAIDYAGQPAGYAAAPGETVNYVENHDNMTLFDLGAMRLPRDTSPEDRARVQLLGAAFVALAQGVAYYHAGIDVLRSKSLDKNSFDSGDAFNRLDWSLTDNGFGAGLPKQADNGGDWPWMRPVLADARIKPAPKDIAWMAGAFRDLLRIRASTTLFRLRTADEVARRLTFPNSGAAQDPRVVVGHLDGNGLAGARFREVLYFLNASLRGQTLSLPEEAGKAWTLHPVQRSDDAVDARPRAARASLRDGTFFIPPRTVVVYVIE